MEINEIISKLNKSIMELITNENDLLKRGLNELNITSHLARYLTPKFPEYNVDPEYNGDRLKPNDRKSLDIARNRMIEIGFNPKENNNYKLSPDIIIHIRDTNENNLVVIEAKKDTNTIKNKEFDLIKLEHLTVDYSGNHYNYKLGVYIEFGTKKNVGNVEIQYFQNGTPKKRDDLT